MKPNSMVFAPDQLLTSHAVRRRLRSIGLLLVSSLLVGLVSSLRADEENVFTGTDEKHLP
jgi:hypothetical protein